MCFSWCEAIKTVGFYGFFFGHTSAFIYAPICNYRRPPSTDFSDKCYRGMYVSYGFWILSYELCRVLMCIWYCEPDLSFILCRNCEQYLNLGQSVGHIVSEMLFNCFCHLELLWLKYWLIKMNDAFIRHSVESNICHLSSSLFNSIQLCFFPHLLSTVRCQVLYLLNRIFFSRANFSSTWTPHSSSIYSFHPTNGKLSGKMLCWPSSRKVLSIWPPCPCIFTLKDVDRVSGLERFFSRSEEVTSTISGKTCLSWSHSSHFQFFSWTKVCVIWGKEFWLNLWLSALFVLLLWKVFKHELSWH